MPASSRSPAMPAAASQVDDQEGRRSLHRSRHLAGDRAAQDGSWWPTLLPGSAPFRRAGEAAADGRPRPAMRRSATRRGPMCWRTEPANHRVGAPTAAARPFQGRNRPISQGPPANLLSSDSKSGSASVDSILLSSQASVAPRMVYDRRPACSRALLAGTKELSCAMPPCSP